METAILGHLLAIANQCAVFYNLCFDTLYTLHLESCKLPQLGAFFKLVAAVVKYN